MLRENFPVLKGPKTLSALREQKLLNTTSVTKVVYGEVELAHRCEYYDNGTLKLAEISMAEEEPLFMCFDEAGVRLSEG